MIRGLPGIVNVHTVEQQKQSAFIKRSIYYTHPFKSARVCSQERKSLFTTYFLEEDFLFKNLPISQVKCTALGELKHVST